MIKNKYPGKFIVFEGLDGSGTSTQTAKLNEKLSRDYKILVTKEPTGNLIGGLIRGQLTGVWRTDQQCLQLLFAADRAHHLEREIIPALKTGRLVLSDRYFFSSVAYGSLDLDKKWILDLNRNFLMPDLSIIIKVSPKECLRRMKKSRYNLELFEEEKKLQKVWQVYNWLSKKFDKVVVIDGAAEKDAVFEKIYQEVRDVI
jgi:dTMP kinase